MRIVDVNEYRARKAAEEDAARGQRRRPWVAWGLAVAALAAAVVGAFAGCHHPTDGYTPAEQAVGWCDPAAVAACTVAEGAWYCTDGHGARCGKCGGGDSRNLCMVDGLLNGGACAGDATCIVQHRYVCVDDCRSCTPPAAAAAGAQCAPSVAQ